MARLSQTANKPSSTPASYEAAVAELESLVQQMEGGTLSLENALVSYQRGAELVKYCQQALAALEAQVKILDDGMLKPWLPNERQGNTNLMDE